MAKGEGRITMLTDTPSSIRLLESINYVDSALFGLSVDIFKVSLFISVIQTAGLREFGFDQNGLYGDDLVFEFRRIQHLKLQISKGEFGPPYLEDGELSAIDLGPSFRTFGIRKVGTTHVTDRYSVYRDMVDIHEVTLDFGTGTVDFAFCDLRVKQFSPEELDT